MLIVGAGGHAQVVADILLRMSEHGQDVQPIGFVDDNAALTDQLLVGIPVLGTLNALDHVPHDALIVGIGDNATRAKIFQALQARTERWVIARHPRATVAPDVTIGLGTVICAGAVLNTQTTIGVNAILNTGCTVDHHGHIGDHVHVAPGSHLGGTVTLGEGAFVGIGASVIPQRTIGAWARVGAGAAVIEDVPAHVTVVGVPARVVNPK